MPTNTTPQPNFRPGQAARHDKFGLGRVVGIGRLSSRVTVDFEHHGSVVVIASYLTPSDEPTPWPDHTPAALVLVAANDNDPLPSVYPSAWHGLPVPERAWFLPGLIPSRTVTILAGDGGLGKSILALQIGAASALAIQTVGLTPTPGRTLYLGAEDEADEFHRRLARIVDESGHTLADLGERFKLLPWANNDAVLASPDRSGKMVETSAMARLRSQVESHGPDLIVLDTSADLFGGDEIKRSQVRQFVGMLRGLAIDLDAAVLLLSHPSVSGMQSGTGSSGSTAWNNSVRSRLYLDRPAGDGVDPAVRLLTTKKSNYGPAGEAIRFRMDDGVFVADDGAERANPAAALIGAMVDRDFLAAVFRLNREGRKLSPNPSQTYAPRLIKAEPEGKPHHVKELSEAMGRLITAGRIEVVESGPASRRYAGLWAKEAPSN